MRKLLCSVLCAILIAASFPFVSRALDYSGVASNGIEWHFVDGVLTVSGEGAVEMDTRFLDGPSSYIYGPAWVSFREFIESVVIEHGITTLPALCFRRHRNVKSVYLSDTVASVGVNCFYDWREISTVTVDENNRYFKAVDNCLIRNSDGCLLIGNQEGVIPDDGSVRKIGINVFNRREFTEVTIPSPVAEIGSEAFIYCTMLETVTLNHGVREISGSAFKNCSSLKNITIPKSVVNIGAAAFEGCSSMTDVFYGGTEEDWSRIKFGSMNEPLENATVHFLNEQHDPIFIWSLDNGTLTLNGDGRIDENTMWNDDSSEVGATPWNEYASGIESVVIGHGITNFPYLHNLDNLKSLTVSDTVKKDGDYWFYCPSKAFERVTVDEANPYYSSAGNCLVDKREKKLIFGFASSVIPDDGSVETIGNNSFEGREGLTGVTVPASVKVIGQQAFKNCTELTSVSFPRGLLTIENNAFDGCTSLDCVELPDTLTDLGESAFCGCSSLREIRIPSSLKTVEAGAFSDCSSLSSLTFDDGVETISGSAFAGCRALTSVVFPDSLKFIYDMAFCGCESLRDVTFGRGAIKTGYLGFYCCTSLERVYFPSSLITVEQYSFEGCDSLSDIFYGGDAARWSRVIICDGNSPLYNANIHYSFPRPTVYVGDVNGDRLITVSDLGALKSGLAGIAAFANCNCDMNGDGLYTVSDVSVLKQMLAG